MNEVTQIHLGRQAFTIAAPAHAELRRYLQAIKKRAGNDVVEEVELRIAELLSDQGFDGEKVVLESDIESIKQNLGQPSDFADDSDAEVDSDTGSSFESRKFYRDVENAWLGGVAAGVASYLGVPVWVVRIIFVGLTFAWGSSILIYAVLWLLVPAAKTPSEKLRMHGKAVTVDTIKEFVDSKNVAEKSREFGEKSAEWAEHVSKNVSTGANGVGRAFSSIFNLIMAILGVAWMAAGIASIMVLLAGGSYVLYNTDRLYGGPVLFPVGRGEQMIALAALSIAVLFFVLCFVAVGQALIKRKWPMPGWLTAVLIGVFLAASAFTAPAIAGTVFNVRDRYQADVRTETRQLSEFGSVEVDSSEVGVSIRRSDKYQIEIQTYGSYDMSKVTTKIENGVLKIYADGFNPEDGCNDWSWCIDLDKLDVVIYTPKANSTTVVGDESDIEDYEEHDMEYEYESEDDSYNDE